jgi:hypothetical protein
VVGKRASRQRDSEGAAGQQLSHPGRCTCDGRSGCEFGCAGRSLPAWEPSGDLLDEPQIAVGIAEGAERPVAGSLGGGAGLACLDAERGPVPHVKHVDAAAYTRSSSLFD